jgi:hypothetical protein
MKALHLSEDLKVLESSAMEAKATQIESEIKVASGAVNIPYDLEYSL